jgi:hypothetical protein
VRVRDADRRRRPGGRHQGREDAAGRRRHRGSRRRLAAALRRRRAPRRAARYLGWALSRRGSQHVAAGEHDPSSQRAFMSLTGRGRSEMRALMARPRRCCGQRPLRGLPGDCRNRPERPSRIGGGRDRRFRSLHQAVDPRGARGRGRRRDVGRSVERVEIPATLRHLDWRVGDLAGAPLEEVRRVREDIERRVVALADELLSKAPEASATEAEPVEQR